MLKEISKSPQDPYLKGEKTGLSLPKSSQPVSLTVRTTVQALTILIQELIFSSGTSFLLAILRDHTGALQCAGSVPPWANTRCWGNIQGTSSTSDNVKQPPKGEVCSVPRLLRLPNLQDFWALTASVSVFYSQSPQVGPVCTHRVILPVCVAVYYFLERYCWSSHLFLTINL